MYDNNNVFAKILRDEAPCVKVYEDEYSLAFMDIMPQLEGHTLVIPKEAAETIFELSDTAALACMKTVKLVAKAVEIAFSDGGSTVFQHNGEAAGQTVPHFHFHIFPGPISATRAMKGHAVELVSHESLQPVAERIRAALPEAATLINQG